MHKMQSSRCLIDFSCETSASHRHRQYFLLDKSCRKMYTIYSAVLRQQRKSDVMRYFGHTARSAVYFKPDSLLRSPAARCKTDIRYTHSGNNSSRLNTQCYGSLASHFIKPSVPLMTVFHIILTIPHLLPITWATTQHIFDKCPLARDMMPIPPVATGHL
jgi:hypothetical protein